MWALIILGSLRKNPSVSHSLSSQISGLSVNEPACLKNGNYLLACLDYESDTIAQSNLNTTILHTKLAPSSETTVCKGLREVLLKQFSVNSRVKDFFFNSGHKGIIPVPPLS